MSDRFDSVVLSALRDLGPGGHGLRHILRRVKLRDPSWPRPAPSCDARFCMSGCWHEVRIVEALDRLVAAGAVSFRRRTESVHSPRVYSLA